MITAVADDKPETIRAALPAEGLFAEKEWLVSPEAFAISEKLAKDLEKLGHQLFVFQRACNQLYQLSARGKQPSWITRLLDAGKPPALVALAREKIFREQLPDVIRPDLILTENGFTIAEIDAVPGGIGLTAWLNQTYAALGEDVIGGKRGMLDGFAEVLPRGGDILVSEESDTYRPEMQWLARQLNDAPAADSPQWRVLPAENYEPGENRDIYRFFEMFDLPNIPKIDQLLGRAARGEVRMTAPPKPFLEEKMWFAFFWLQPLREFWRRELGDKYFRQLQQVIPYTWLLDPTPLPQHAVIPRLEIHDWREAAKFSQKHRDILLKVSGFSPLGWGSRGVALGADLPQADWQRRIEEALDHFETRPMLMQQFHKGALFEQNYQDLASREMRVMKGRVRLCPYYFVSGNKAEMRGALATIVPADKKLIHGMRDGILVPTKVSAPAP